MADKKVAKVEVELELDSTEEINAESLTIDILSGEELEKAVDYLVQEYSIAKNEMDSRNQKIKKWRSNMEALQSDVPKTSPFQGATNVNVGVTQMLTQPLAATIKAVFKDKKPLFNVTSIRRNEEDINVFKAVSKYINLLADSPTDINMAKIINDLVDETVLIGGSFPKVGWLTEISMVMGENGEQSEIVWHDGPSVTVVPAEKVVYRRGISDMQRLPWIAVEHSLTEYELKERAARGIYSDVEEILTTSRTEPTDLEGQQQEAEYGDSVSTMGLYDVVEFWFKWDITGSGIATDLVFIIHTESKTVLKQQYNKLGVRTIANCPYISRPNTLLGRGTGQLTEGYQAEVTGWHNLRGDNAKIANMRIVAMKRPLSLKSVMKIYPGAVIYTDNPMEDIVPKQLGEVYPSSLQAEMQGMSYAQRTVGFSDIQAGFADTMMKSRDSVRGSLQRLQTGNGILAQTIENIAEAISKVGMFIWLQCVLNKDIVISREEQARRLSSEEIEDLKIALNIPMAEVPTRMAFFVQTTDPDKTYDMQRQNLMVLTQLFSQFGNQSITLASQLFGPGAEQMKSQAPELWAYMMRILVGAGKLMSDMFEFFGFPNTKDYVPSMDQMDKFLDMMQTASNALRPGALQERQLSGPQPVPSSAGYGMAPEGPQMANTMEEPY